MHRTGTRGVASRWAPVIGRLPGKLVPVSTPYIVSDEVAAALAAGGPVVALESTIISHGLPRPRNHQAAQEFEQILRDAGVTPAT
ncbi:MAG: pseudouridylate synthase, partial [Microbacteriaceae bacterium]|nr:pseudouridylate synthase [Microbacteriaceae bacterium]